MIILFAVGFCLPANCCHRNLQDFIFYVFIHLFFSLLRLFCCYCLSVHHYLILVFSFSVILFSASHFCSICTSFRLFCFLSSFALSFILLRSLILFSLYLSPLFITPSLFKPFLINSLPSSFPPPSSLLLLLHLLYSLQFILTSNPLFLPSVFTHSQPHSLSLSPAPGREFKHLPRPEFSAEPSHHSLEGEVRPLQPLLPHGLHEGRGLRMPVHRFVLENNGRNGFVGGGGGDLNLNPTVGLGFVVLLGFVLSF